MHPQSEQEIQNAVRVALSSRGHKVFRANVGKVRLPNGRWFETGLPKGFPDLFGYRKTDGKTFFIEMKNAKGKRRPEQIQFGNMMTSQPVLYGVARSVDDAIKIVEETL
ncbi:VRR-NUC domain-containing protein [Weissella coleopterorum]|uniref:VRR-NUC domain-containing protein n=1 Tax=Weissella coleopterorum TaxID=2714949 RepID=A0A6G8AYB6_9LACO|nr:VRR-NUC domain-containing protein [Weissella coleopterorum]QIL49873.1 VRR-NUC domain-containing protein [Weissella coleopterorum]